MTIQIGQRIPAAELVTMTPEGRRTVTTEELFAGKTVVLFAVPGAFTATCSNEHLPGFVTRVHEFAEKGVDTVACVAVNDVSVMSAWGKSCDVGGKVLMLADGNGDFTRAMGLEVDLTRFKMGHRSKRYACIVRDGVIEHLQIESGGGVGVSSAESMLSLL